MTTKVTVSIPRDTGLDIDTTTNTFHFRTLTGNPWSSSDVDQATEALRNFYDVIPPAPATTKLTSFMSALNTSPALVKFYQIPAVAGPLGVPYAEREMVLTFPNVGGADDTPEENAVCLSYRHIAEVGENQKRMRGRIYIGPLRTDAWSVVNGRIRVNPLLQNTLTQAGKDLQLAIRDINTNTDWVVWSPTTRTEHVINELWVDNAVDTVRSRGAAPDARVAVTV